jgi:hypothetical protein
VYCLPPRAAAAPRTPHCTVRPRQGRHRACIPGHVHVSYATCLACVEANKVVGCVLPHTDDDDRAPCCARFERFHLGFARDGSSFAVEAGACLSRVQRWIMAGRGAGRRDTAATARGWCAGATSPLEPVNRCHPRRAAELLAARFTLTRANSSVPLPSCRGRPRPRVDRPCPRLSQLTVSRHEPRRAATPVARGAPRCATWLRRAL